MREPGRQRRDRNGEHFPSNLKHHHDLTSSMKRNLALILTLAGLTASSQAELIYGLTGANQLVSFDSANPNLFLSTVQITGSSADILNIDIRPATGALFGLDGNNNLYTLDINSGVAALVGPTGVSGGFDYGFDFNPTVDRIRVVTDAGGNFRINPLTGATLTDGTPTYIAGDVNAGTAPVLTGAAYTNNVNGAVTTTLYAIDAELDILARSTNANAGTYVTQGGLGVDITGLNGFDISGLTGTAYAALSTDAVLSSLYTIDLATGAASLAGGIGAPVGTTILDIAALTPNASAAPIPEPSTALFGLALTGLVGLARRRRA
jgi:hypothetical protein